MPHQSDKTNQRLLVILAFAAIYLLWGSTYIGIVIALETIPPFLMAGSRFVIAGLMLYGWGLINRQQTPGAKSLRLLSLTGILMLVGGTGAVIWVEQFIPSGLTAIIVATVPLWFVLLDKYEWSFHFSDKKTIIGLVLGFAGVILLFADKQTFSFTENRIQVISFFVLIAGTISWAIGTLISKYKKMEGTPVMKAAWQMIAAGIVSFVIAFIFGEHDRFSWTELSLNSILAVIYLIVAGSLLGYLAYIWLLSIRRPSLVGTYAYVNPVVAVFLGWLIANEKTNAQQMVALIIILGGVLLVNTGKKNEDSPPTPLSAKEVK